MDNNLTSDQRRQVGKLLGYPECCVEAYISDIEQGAFPGNMRGNVCLGQRTTEEAARLDAEVSTLIGRPWALVSTDLKKSYVPCDGCQAEQLIGTR